MKKGILILLVLGYVLIAAMSSIDGGRVKWLWPIDWINDRLKPKGPRTAIPM